MNLQIKDADNFSVRLTFRSVMNLKSLNALGFPLYDPFCQLNLFCGFDDILLDGFCSSFYHPTVLIVGWFLL
jgi:hypothetical protein